MKEEWNIKPYLGVLPLVFSALKRAFSAPRICTVDAGYLARFVKEPTHTTEESWCTVHHFFAVCDCIGEKSVTDCRYFFPQEITHMSLQKAVQEGGDSVQNCPLNLCAEHCTENRKAWRE